MTAQKKLNKNNFQTILMESTLSANARLMGYTLMGYYKYGYDTYPSIRSLTRSCGFGSDNTTLKSIKELVDYGLIKITKKHINKSSFISSCYEFTVALDETVDETANATANATANDVSPRDTEYIENEEYVEINNNKNNQIENQNEKINKMLNKIGEMPNSILIDDSFKCSDYPIFEPYIKEMPPEIIADVQKWIIKTKKGQSINQDFVSKLFIKFAQRQGKPIFKQRGIAK